MKYYLKDANRCQGCGEPLLLTDLLTDWPVSRVSAYFLRPQDQSIVFHFTHSIHLTSCACISFELQSWKAINRQLGARLRTLAECWCARLHDEVGMVNGNGNGNVSALERSNWLMTSFRYGRIVWLSRSGVYHWCSGCDSDELLGESVRWRYVLHMWALVSFSPFNW